MWAALSMQAGTDEPAGDEMMSMDGRKPIEANEPPGRRSDSRPFLAALCPLAAWWFRLILLSDPLSGVVLAAIGFDPGT